MWTIERIKKLCVEYCGKVDVPFDAPIGINSRFTTTLGRCSYKFINGIYTPTKIEFSKQLLETATDESIEAVIGHECAHYVTIFLTREKHGHDATFRSYCKKRGVTNSAAIYHDIKYKENHEPAEEYEIFKYSIYCSCCGKLVANRRRACKITKQTSLYSSSCCNASLKVIQNW